MTTQQAIDLLVKRVQENPDLRDTNMLYNGVLSELLDLANPFDSEPWDYDDARKLKPKN